MPAANSKVPTNGNVKSGAASTSRTATPVTSNDLSDSLTTFAGGKPDKKAYDAEQAKFKTEIDTLQEKLVDIFVLSGEYSFINTRVPSAIKLVLQLNLVLGMTGEMFFALNWIVFVINNSRTKILEGN